MGGAGKWRDEDAASFTADHHVTVLPDNDDTGRRHADDVARSLVGRVASVTIVELPNLPEKGDVTDWLEAQPDPDAALERLCQVVDDADAYTAPDNAPVWTPEAQDASTTTGNTLTPPALIVKSALDVINEPEPATAIEGVAYADRVSVLVAESAAGKTFVLLDAAAHVSADLAWHGRNVVGGSVLYISFEGDAIGLRLRALRQIGHTLEHVHILQASDPLSPLVDRERVESPSRGELTVTDAITQLAADLAATNRPPIRLVVIDTIRASLSGSEDSSESVSAYLRAARRLLTNVSGAALVLAHHSGWLDGESKRKRERRSSAFRGNVDVTLYLEVERYDADQGEAELTLSTRKIRDSERPAPLRLIRRRVELNEDDGHGQPVTSCVIEADRRSREDRDAAQQQAAEAEHRDLDKPPSRSSRGGQSWRRR